MSINSEGLIKLNFSFIFEIFEVFLLETRGFGASAIFGKQISSEI